MNHIITKFFLISLIIVSFNGCLLAALGVGAEAGYVASQEDRTVKETLNDQAIVSTVKTKLLANSEVSGLDINVDSFKGVVTLKGVVGTQAEVSKAIAIASGVSGVKSVRSKLFVE